MPLCEVRAGIQGLRCKLKSLTLRFDETVLCWDRSTRFCLPPQTHIRYDQGNHFPCDDQLTSYYSEVREERPHTPHKHKDSTVGFSGPRQRILIFDYHQLYTIFHIPYTLIPCTIYAVPYTMYSTICHIHPTVYCTPY